MNFLHDNVLKEYASTASNPCLTHLLDISAHFCTNYSQNPISGAQIILSMKVIGLGFDVSAGVLSLPSVMEYMAYIFNAGNVIFGPWVSFQDFQSLYSTNVSKCLVSYK